MKTKRTIEEQLDLYDKLYQLDLMDIKDKALSSRVVLLDLHRMDGLTDEQFDEVEQIYNKIITTN